MAMRSFRQIATGVLAVFVIAGVFLVDSSAQRRRHRRRSSAPRITNPAIYQPSPTDNANANSSDAQNSNENTNTQTNSQSPDEMKQTIRTLSSQVDKLTNKINQMEESQRSLVDLERLSRAEQRATSLRTELRDVQAKETELQAHAEEIDYALKPENIERTVAVYGTTHPEEAREQRRRQLEAEKDRTRKQLEVLASSRTHLEQAIAAADVEVEKLRKRIDAADAAAIQNAKTNEQSTEGTSQPRPYASPTPTPGPPR